MCFRVVSKEMSFRLAFNLFYDISCATNANNSIVKHIIYKTTNFRCLSSKTKDFKYYKRNDDLEKESIPSFKVMLKEGNGKILGVRTKQEADLLAKKNSLFLIEEKVNKTQFAKYPIYLLVSAKEMAKFNESMDNKDVQNKDNVLETSDEDLDQKKTNLNRKVREVKRIAFSAKVQENDLMTKIRQTKKWLSKGCEVKVIINSPQNDKILLENTYQHFERELKGMVRFTQKKVSDNDLKFTLFSSDETKDQIKDKVQTNEHSIDFDNLDPNKLLTDEFEELLNKK